MTHPLELKAQEVAEQRLVDATESMWEDLDEEYVAKNAHNLAGWFCGCDTCIVREVLDAAWPYLYQLAHHPETEPPV